MVRHKDGAQENEASSILDDFIQLGNLRPSAKSFLTIVLMLVSMIEQMIVKMKVKKMRHHSNSKQPHLTRHFNIFQATTFILHFQIITSTVANSAA